MAAPGVDFPTWRALGRGRTSSNRLPAGADEAARAAMDGVIAKVGVGGWVERDGKRCRIVERTESGLKIDGGPGGFAERVVTTTDLAWVVVAAADVEANGGVLDEARVNRLRYLEGTPKGSTRWVDTGWALVLRDGAVAKLA